MFWTLGLDGLSQKKELRVAGKNVGCTPCYVARTGSASPLWSKSEYAEHT